MSTTERRSKLASRIIAGLDSGALKLQGLVERAIEAPGTEAWARECLRNHKRQADRADAQLDPDSGVRAMQALAAARKTLARRQGVDSVHLGLKVQDGQTLPTPSVVITVARKLPDHHLAARARFPRTLIVDASHVPTDVVETRRARKQASARAGRDTSVRAVGTGVLSAVRVSASNARIYLSGHVAGGTAADIQISPPGGGSVSVGRATRCRDDAWVDSAVVVGISPALIGQISTTAVEVRELDARDLGLPVRVDLARSPDVVWSYVHGLERPVNFLTGRMRGLIELEDHVTRRGDSGSPVLDVSGRLIGFVIGSDGRRTIVLPAKRGLSV